ncbi:MAG: M14 family zinc carboxypeptidase [Bacteroidia bacterium]
MNFIKVHPAFFLIFFAVIITSFSAYSQDNAEIKYSKVKIYANGLGLQKLAEQGVTIDHGETKQDVFFISDFSEKEVQTIIKSGFKYEILIDDVGNYYATQNDLPENQIEYAGTLPCKPGPNKIPSHFHLGNYAGFFGYDQMLEILDSMQLLYPNLISKRAPIDSTTTYGKRSLYWLRISNKPNESQPAKPQVFYNALHHAREPGSISQIIYFMWYLLDNYATDKEVQGMVDNLELYFVPCVNPDGYTANIKAKPSGGGMQRVNNRGVDINRNYDYKWGYDNSGSSGSAGDTYRGPSAGSEAETKMMKKFCINHNFKLAMSCHTYGGLLIFPWGYKTNFFTPDNKIFLGYAKFIAQVSKYKIGTPNQTVNYITNGSSDDWFYGEQKLKNKIFEFTPEAGSSFYPAKNQIIPFCKEVLDMNIRMAKLALKYVVAEDTQPYYITNKSGYFHYNYTSMVPDTMSNFTISIIPISPEIKSVGSPRNYTMINIDKTLTDSISYNLDPLTPSGTIIKYVLKITNGQFTHADTLEKTSGDQTILIADNGNNMNNWLSSSWNLSSTVFHSPSSSITDSPTGKYANNANTTITTKNSIDLTDAKNALLTYWAKWDVEENYDYVEIQASADSGKTWTPLCGKYSTLGTKDQDINQPVYDGQMNWVQEEISLQDYLGGKVWFRFVLKSDAQNVFDGFYFDDFMVSKLNVFGSGIKEIKGINPFQVSNCMPNPAHDYVYINYQIANLGNSPVTLVVSNLEGQTVYSKKIDNYTEGNVLINTAHLPNGVYTYCIQSNTNKSLTKRMCIVH